MKNKQVLNLPMHRTNAVYLFLECFFISGVEFFTVNNQKMHTFDLLIVKGDTFGLLIVKCVSYD